MIKSITSTIQLRAAIAHNYCTCIIIYRENDWGSTQMRALCAAIARENPAICFGEVSYDTKCDIDAVVITYVPTLCIWRNGRLFTQIVGADIDRVRATITSIVHNEINANEGNSQILRAPNHAIMTRRTQKKL